MAESFPGTFTASIAVDDLLSVSGVNGVAAPSSMAAADWRVAVTIEAPPPAGTRVFGTIYAPLDGFYGSQSVDGSGTLSTFGVGPNGTVTLSAPIFFGTPFTLTVSFAVDTSATLSAAVTPPLTSGLALSSAEAIYVHTAV